MKRDRQDVIELVSRLVEIPSVNPDLVPGAAGEGELARFVASWLEAAGLEVVLTEVAPGRPNVVAIAPGTGEGKGLMLNAHLDTVGPGGMADPFSPRVEGTRLYGRGAYDMKGSLAAIMLVAAEAARQEAWQGDLVITAVADEEFASIGTQAIVDNQRLIDRVQAAIVTEPTGLDLTVAHNGFVWFEIETHGIAAHGSRGDLGVDAIAKMGMILIELDALNRDLAARPVPVPRWPASVHASLIRGGQELSSYPLSCLVEVERRTSPGETREAVEAEIEAILERARGADPDLRVSARTTLVRDGYAIAEQSRLVELMQRQIAARTGVEPELTGQGGWMDSALLGGAGLPTVIFGPGGEGAHADIEWVDLEQVEQAAHILFDVAGEICG